MDQNWTHISEGFPQTFQDVIVCSDEDKVKPAKYLGNNKWDTYLKVEYWMSLPTPPKHKIIVSDDDAPKRRGRPKKEI